MFWLLERPENFPEEVIYGSISGNGDRIWKTKLCPSCGRYQIVEQLTNLKVELFGSVLLDFVWIDDPSIIIVESLANLLENSGLRGFSFRIVDVIAHWREDTTAKEIIDWTRFEAPPRLSQMVINGRGGSIFPQNEACIQKICDVCGLKAYRLLTNGLLVDVNQWDGSDVFVMEEFPGYVVITDKFLQYLVDNGVQGFNVTAVEKIIM